MATWPNLPEVVGYIGEVNDDQLPVLQRCLDAAVAYIGWRCDENIDVNDYYEEIVPENLREATKELTSRLFHRRLSPQGVAGFGDFGAVRVTRIDPDIERLITPQVSWGIA